MKNKKLLLVTILLLTISALLGISFSLFTFFGEGNTNNVIETGRVKFSYSDAEKKGNGIFIEDALPIKDKDALRLAGENDYFDFTVTASTTGTDIAYEIVVNKDESSTLSDEMVKIYLAEIDGNVEVPVPFVESNIPTYNELKDTTNQLINGKTIYYGTVKAGEVAYGKKFRLRMWINYPEDGQIDYEAINDKSYKVKVNVVAVGSK